MELKQCLFNDVTELTQLVELQNKVYKHRGLHFSQELFQYWYEYNPVGRVISFNAFDKGMMVAHQSFVPEEMIVGDRVVRCLRSMAVVTHPEYRGRHLFSQLTNAAIEEAKRQGYEFIYAITNENSTPIFLKHCGFSLITKLQVKIGIGTDIKANEGCLYRRHWTLQTLKWRLSYRPYYIYNHSIIGSYGYGVKTYMATIDSELLNQIDITKQHVGIGCYLYIGLGAKLPWSFMNMPKFVKHSPFNLIFRDLTGGQLPPMTADNVFYQLLDYDVA